MKKKKRGKTIDLSKNRAYKQMIRLVRETFEKPEAALAMPDRIVVMDPSIAGRVFNKEKMRLVIEIKSNKNTLSISELAEILHRAQPAVSRDVAELREYGILNLKESGKRRIPVLKKQMAVVPL